jgi:NADPH:quinone reductase-like Zn-dependent oxidoreductase
MKAAVRSKYGLPGVLAIQDLEIPRPKANEVLVKVHATTANRTDYHVLTGKPFFMRFFTGLFKPRLSIIGSDFAGEVEATGSAVRSFKPGDRIMGFGGVFGCGSHARYFTLPESKAKNTMITMPSTLGYDEAAACLEGAFYAGSGILQLAPQAGQKVLIYGAGGAIGSSYVQFFKHYDLWVTAVCTGGQGELMRSLGADKVVDYEMEDFAKGRERYDYIFDAVNKTGFFKCKPLLKKKGIYGSSGGFEYLLLALLTSIVGGKKVIFKAPKDVPGTLGFIRDLVEKGKFKPIIDRKYPIDRIAEAFIYVASGQKTGNVIITMD